MNISPQLANVLLQIKMRERKPQKIKFSDIQVAIYEANKSEQSNKKLAWQKVYRLSEKYKLQEEEK
jgi:hypothetical protein